MSRWFLDRPGTHRMWAVCDVDNRASARVLEKSDFELEGMLRRWMMHPNVSDTPRDALCYSLLRKHEGAVDESQLVAKIEALRGEEERQARKRELRAVGLDAPASSPVNRTWSFVWFGGAALFLLNAVLGLVWGSQTFGVGLLVAMAVAFFLRGLSVRSTLRRLGSEEDVLPAADPAWLDRPGESLVEAGSDPVDSG